MSNPTQNSTPHWMDHTSLNLNLASLAQGIGLIKLCTSALSELPFIYLFIFLKKTESENTTGLDTTV